MATKFKLSDIETVEVSLVPKGANNKKFFLMKTADGDKVISAEEFLSKAMLCEDHEFNKICDGLSPDLKDQVKAISKFIEVLRDKLPDESVNQILQLTLGSHNGENKMADKETNTPDNKEELAKAAAAEALSKEHRETKEKLEKAEKESTELKKALEDTTKRTEALEKSLKEKEEIALTKEYIGIAGEFKNLGINSAEFGPVLKTFAQASKEGFDKLMAVLKAADATCAAAFDSKGSDAKGTTLTADAAYEKLEGLAKAHSESKKVSIEKARLDILETKEGSEAYAQYDAALKNTKGAA